MRVNIYSQELIGDAAVVSTTADTGEVYHGVRLFLHSSPRLHRRQDDDDRSAVTFWIPDANSFSQISLAHLFMRLANLTLTAPQSDPRELTPTDRLAFETEIATLKRLLDA
jgi:hypothetical protein